ncbi:molybdopterin molybdotransferase MoeA [Fodinibius salsisoli]|uniref:Molybdopterin molybdenumtransferase n=1 Tax=Fodinibius salsisoli TaxID=2820877 RepID=A0ABT3PTG7_9BACT|nr:molybdopterin molybdotransferase MoeA [Fodinibius salsisoli]MCW9709164.1 molybdopterin molybdotransferase MoeA [Fodinibius salsisoli]
MIGVLRAEEIIRKARLKPEVEEVAIAEAAGRVLQEVIRSDRDLPPFDRVMMDGIAIRYDQWKEGQTTFPVAGLQKAGDPQHSLEKDDYCLEVMTGAMLPPNTDTVIRYEDVSIKTVKGREVAVINRPPKKKGQNIHPKGTNRPKGKILVDEGIVLSPAEIAVAATVGKSSLKVTRPPRVAIVATGDELVDIHEEPLPHQIRRSNVYAVSAAVQGLHIDAQLFHLRDNKEEISRSLKEILEAFEVVILSGGVSKGKLDYIPEVLAECGVKKHLHKVRQRPGKPLWFGTSEQAVVFALPGNPVSTFMCYYRYVEPWLKRQVGIENKPLIAQLTKDFTFEKELTYFLQVQVQSGKDGVLEATPVKGKGSSDFANLCRGDGFLELPEQQSHFKKGQAYPLYLYKHL